MEVLQGYIRVQERGAAIADRVAAPNGKYTYSTPECSKVASRHVSRLPLSNYHLWHLIGRPNRIVEEREPFTPTLFYFVKQVNES
jgi:hypothetical protein